jgi:hypothetical protein
MVPLAMSMKTNDTMTADSIPTATTATSGASLLAAAAALPDKALLARVNDLAMAARAVAVEMITHLGELERRGLHRGQGCGSLYGYCIQVLKMSEAEAVNRIRAARAARRFPVILERLAEGRLNLTSVKLLAPHLTPENHRALLDEASGMTRREVDKIVARLSPRPSVPSSIRALAPGRYGLSVTLGEQAHDDLRWLQDAERREVPDGDPSEIVTRSLRARRREVEKALFSATERPRASKGVKPGARGISAEVERAVWGRDGGRCAFVAANGRRCTETSYLEFHHRDPYAFGGQPTVANIALLCRAHNEYESERAFGREVATRWRWSGRAAVGGRGRSATGPGTSREKAREDAQEDARREAPREPRPEAQPPV